jgi:hypothetical protein
MKKLMIALVAGMLSVSVAGAIAADDMKKDKMDKMDKSKKGEAKMDKMDKKKDDTKK